MYWMNFVVRQGRRLGSLNPCCICQPIFVNKKTSAINGHLGIPLIANLGQFLNMLTIHGHVNDNMFKYVLDWVQNKLAKWKTKALTFATSVMLAKSVTSSIMVCDANSKITKNSLHNY